MPLIIYTVICLKFGENKFLFFSEFNFLQTMSILPAEFSTS